MGLSSIARVPRPMPHRFGKAGLVAILSAAAIAQGAPRAAAAMLPPEKEEVRDYRGDPQQLFVSGHSAGGHLAALLAADETYLQQVGRSADDIRGVIGISGVYRVDDFDLSLCLSSPRGGLQLNLDVRPSAVVFGDDPEVVRRASPLTHVRPGLPPFLILS